MRTLLATLLALSLLLPNWSAAQQPSPRDQGQSLLAAGRADEATAHFIKAISRDRRDFHAMHGLGLCQYAADDLPAAAATLRRAARLARGASDTTLVVNLAAVELELGNAMAAAIVCAEHLKQQGDAPAEAALDALSAALATAQNTHGATRAFREAQRVEAAATADLEATRPGMKRWGNSWVPAEEYDQRSAGDPPVYPQRIEILPLGAPPPSEPTKTAPKSPRKSPKPAAADPVANDPPRDNDQPPAAQRLQSALAVPIGPNLMLAPAAAIGEAKTVRLESTQGVQFQATVVRIDGDRKLALLKVEDRRLMYFNLADNLEEGPVKCTAVLRPVVFNLAADLIDGQIHQQDEVWSVQLEHAPLLSGSPLTRDGRIVGIVINGSDRGDVEMIPLGAVRGFLGHDRPRPMHVQADPRSSVYQVTADR